MTPQPDEQPRATACWRPTRSTLCAAGILAALTLYNVHRIMGAGYGLEGDAWQQVYYRLNPAIHWCGYDPATRDYFPSSPICGILNPFYYLFKGLLLPLSPWVSDVTRALFEALLCGALLQFVVSQIAYLFLRRLGRSQAASLLGSIIVTFTGMPANQIREFDHMYQVSLLCVPPLVLLALRLGRGERRWSDSVFAAGALIGLSLLGGSNVPMFYYLPGIFLIPLIAAVVGRNRAALIRGWSGLAVAGLIGLLIAAPIVLPGMSNVRLQLRGNISFSESEPHGDPTAPVALNTLFLRDWWTTQGTQIHERDVYFGFAVVTLVLGGIGMAFRRGNPALDLPDATAPNERRVVSWFMLFCLLMATAVYLFRLLPSFLQFPLSRFYELQSIRHPGRFGMLAQLPMAYFAALGLDRRKGLGTILLAVIATVFTAVLLVRMPSDNLLRAFPDARWAAGFSLGGSCLAVLGLILDSEPLRGLFRRVPVLRRPVRWIVVGIAATFVYAPLQRTAYPNIYVAVNLPSHLADEPLTLAGFLGWTNGYGKLIESTRQALLQPPPHLLAPETREGRVWDPQISFFLCANSFHANQTGHSYIFIGMVDPDAHRYLYDIFATNNANLYRLAGVRWIVLPSSLQFPKPMSSQWQRQTTVAELSGALPLAFFVRNADFIANENSVLSLLKNSTMDELASKLLLSSEPRGEVENHSSPSTRRNVSVFRVGGVDRLYKLGPGPEGYLFLSVPYHWDWRVTVDGAPAEILRADYAFMAVRVPAGASQVRWHFTQPLRSLGLVISAATIAILTIILAVSICLRRRRAADALLPPP